MTVSKEEGQVISTKKIQRGLAFLHQFPQKRFFQLFVDGNVHMRENGQDGYELREPGCVGRFYDGFIHAINNITQPLSVTLLLEIHNAACHGLQGDFNTTRVGKFRDCPMREMEFFKEMCTIEGIKEQMMIGKSYGESDNTLGDAINVYRPQISRRINLLQYHYFSLISQAQDIYEHSEIHPLCFTPPANSALLANEAQKIIDEYLTQIQEAQNTDTELLAIVRCAKRLLLLHPFADGNLRVTVDIVINFLLLQRGYPPCIFYEPNVFYLFATQELVDVVKIGMVDSLFVIHNPDLPLFGYEVRDAKYLQETQKMKEAIEELSARYPLLHDALKEEMHQLEHDLQYSMSPIIQRFHLAATQGCMDGDPIQLIDILKEKGPENTTSLFKGKTLLHVAFLTGHYKLLNSLLECSPQLINEHDLSGKTVLHYAIEHGQGDWIKYFISNPYLDLDCEPLSYLDFAITGYDIATAETLLELGVKITSDSYKAIPDAVGYKAKFCELLDKYNVGNGLSPGS